MPRIHATNRDRSLSIEYNAFETPHPDRLIDRWSRASGNTLPLDEASDEGDGRLALVLNCFSHHYASKRGYRSDRDASIETWVIGRDADGVFADWFDGMPDSYRAIVHRQAAYTPWGTGPVVHVPWDITTSNLRLATRRTTTPHMRDTVRGVLDDLLVAYDGGNPRAVMESLGHPVAYSIAKPYVG